MRSNLPGNAFCRFCSMSYQFVCVFPRTTEQSTSSTNLSSSSAVHLWLGLLPPVSSIKPVPERVLFVGAAFLLSCRFSVLTVLLWEVAFGLEFPYHRKFRVHSSNSDTFVFPKSHESLYPIMQNVALLLAQVLLCTLGPQLLPSPILHSLHPREQGCHTIVHYGIIKVRKLRNQYPIRGCK